MFEAGSVDTAVAVEPRPRSRAARPYLGTTASNLLITALTAAGGILLARALGSAGRGAIGTIVLWPTVVGGVLLMGLPEAVCYLVSRRPREASSIVSTATLVMLGLSLVAAGAGYVLAPMIGQEAQVVAGLRTLFALLPLYCLPVVWIASLQALQLPRWNMARLVHPVIYLGALAAATATDAMSVRVAVLIVASSFVLTSLVAAALTVAKIGPPRAPRRSHLRPLLDFGSKTGASNVPHLLGFRLDQLVLTLVVGAAAIGNYLVAASIGLLVVPAASAFGHVAFPRIAGTASGPERDGWQRTALRSSAVVAFGLIAVLVLVSPWLVPVVFGPAFDRVVPLMRILGPAAAASAVCHVAEDILRGRGDPGTPAKAETAGLLASAVLLAILVPAWGLYGAAAASLASRLVVAALLWRELRMGRSVAGSHAA